MALDIEQFYRRYGPMVLRRCERLLRDPEKAADAMHDVFVEILRRKEMLTDEAPSSLLLLTATNLCLNRLRSARRFFGKLAKREPLEQIIREPAIGHDLSSSSTARSFKSRRRFRTPETDIPTSAATSSRVRPSSR